MMIHGGILQGSSTNYKQEHFNIYSLKYIQAFNIFTQRTFSSNKGLKTTENVEIQSAALGFWLQFSAVRHTMSCSVKQYCTILQKGKASSSLKDEGRGNLMSSTVNY